MAARSLTFPPPRRGDASRTQWAVAGGVVVAAHLAAGWGLLQLRAVRDAVAERAPLFVDFIAPPPAPQAVKPPPPAAPPRMPAPAPLPAAVKRQPPMPAMAAAPLVAAAPAPATFATPPPAEAPRPAPVVAEASPVPLVPAEPPAPAAPPAAPPPAAAAKTISTAPGYLVPPAPVYPAASSRLRETGTVVVRVLIGEDGSAREVRVQQSSGYPRLDAAAVAAVRKARFRPYTDDGVAVAVWAPAPIEFELEK